MWVMITLHYKYSIYSTAWQEVPIGFFPPSSLWITINRNDVNEEINCLHALIEQHNISAAEVMAHLITPRLSRRLSIRDEEHDISTF